MGDGRKFTQAEEEFIGMLVSALPPVIARKEVSRHLGGIVAPQTLSNADSAGVGPDVAFRVGRMVTYRTESLARWIVRRYGVIRIACLKTL